MSRKRLTRKQIIHKLRQAEVERGKGQAAAGELTQWFYKPPCVFVGLPLW